MRRKNTESIGEVLRQYFEQNPFIKRKIAENRAIKGWYAILGQAASNYTTNIYLRNNTMYIHLSSAVLRSELLMAKDRLIKSLNDYAGMQVVNDLIIR